MFIVIAIEVLRCDRLGDGDPGQMPPDRKIPIMEIIAPIRANGPQKSAEIITPHEETAAPKNEKVENSQSGSSNRAADRLLNLRLSHDVTVSLRVDRPEAACPTSAIIAIACAIACRSSAAVMIICIKPVLEDSI